MVFGLNKQDDEFFTTQFMFLFILAYLFFVYSNGYATLVFLENEYPDYLISEVYSGEELNSSLVLNYTLFNSADYEFIIQDYRDKVGFRNSWIPKVRLGLYFLMCLHALTIFKLKRFDRKVYKD